jgi:hypothetical protein
LGVPVIPVIPLVVSSLLDRSDVLPIWFGSFFAFAAIFLVIAGPLVYSNNRPVGARAYFRFRLFWFLFGLSTCGFALYNILRQPDLAHAPQYLIVAVSAIVQILFYVVASILFVAVPGTALAARRVMHAPDARLVDNILIALKIVCRTDALWTNFDSKTRLMTALESAAKTASEGLPRALRTGDPYTERWLRKRCYEIAASLRAKKTWVCMPKFDTREQLEAKLVKCFIDAASGNWDGLETAELPQFPPQDIKVRLGALLVGLVEALLPAAGYFGAQWLVHRPQGPLSDYLAVGVFLWALIVILSGLDPRFGEKVETVVKVVSLECAVARGNSAANSHTRKSRSNHGPVHSARGLRLERVLQSARGRNPHLQAYALNHPLECERPKAARLEGTRWDGRSEGADAQGHWFVGRVDPVAGGPQGEAGVKIKRIAIRLFAKRDVELSAEGLKGTPAAA